MATPTENFIDTPWISITKAGAGKALVDGTKWGSGQLGEGVTMTWSVPQGIAYFDTAYSSYNEPSAWYALSSYEIGAATRALRAWTDVSGLRATRVSDNASVVGEIRFAKTTQIDADSDAHAYLPANLPRAGDIWLNAQTWNETGNAGSPGTYDYHTVLHEIGHALGLKHPFEGSDTNSTKLSASLDSYFYTVMSYTVKTGLGTSGWADFYPTTPMYLDQLALQYLYGRDTATRASSTTYKFVAGKKYWEAIYDAGGTDTIVYQGAADTTIDLRPGKFSSLSDPITFSDGSSTRSTVTIGPNVVIERAVGGSGSDVLTGNSANNLLKGGSGRDKLFGGAGNDALYGGVQDDYLRGDAGNDRFFFNTALSGVGTSNVDRIVDFSVRDDTIYLDDAIFGSLKKGALSASAFCIGAKAKDSSDRIIYNKSSGDLSYDPDGTGKAEAVKFATMAKLLKLTQADFYVI